MREKAFANWQITVLKVINFRKNVQNWRKLQTFLLLLFGISKTPSCLQKVTPNETVGMSRETPNFSNTKAPDQGGYNIEDFTARLWQQKRFS